MTNFLSVPDIAQCYPRTLAASLGIEPGDASTADRYQVVLHVTAETLDQVQTSPAVGARIAGDSIANLTLYILGRYVSPTPLPDDATIEDWMVSRMQDIEIDDTTCVPNWMAGDKMDWDLAVGHLFQSQ